MQDDVKSKEQLIIELRNLRQRVAELEKEQVGRKRAEEALPESEELYRTLISLSPDAISVTDLNGLLTLVSPKARQLFGNSPDEEIFGHSVLCWVDPEDQGKASANIRNLLTEGSLIDTEYTLIRKDGTRFIGEVNAAVIPSPDGSPGRVIFITRDITERKREQDELFNSRQMLRSVLDNIPQRVFWKDRNSVYLGCNKSLAVDCGYKDPSELVGQTDYETASAATADLYRADDQEVMETGEAKLRFEESQIKPDGSKAWLITSKVPMYDNNGQVIGVLGTYEDITERKRMEEVLRDSQSLLSTIIESIPFEFWAIGQDGRYMLANSVCVNHYGNIVGKRPEDICDDQETLSAWQENNRNAFSGKLVSEDVKSSFGGVERFHHTITTAIHDGDQIKGILGVNIDITERKQMEDELRKSRDKLELRVRERTAELEKANQELRQIPSKLISVQEEERKRLASELHDGIGQTLVAIKLIVEMALLAKGEDHIRDALEKLQLVAPTLRNVIKEIRDIYTGLRPTLLDNLGLISTLQWFCREFENLHPNCSINLQTTVKDGNIPKELRVVIFRIAQEALNNVAKHSKAKQVDIFLSGSSNGIELTVSDYGVGMDLDQILRTSAARGLGFTTMKERAELSGGSFSINSASGEGTTVRASWPYEAKDQLQESGITQ
jgi:PAS domain S-box-containing protein